MSLPEDPTYGQRLAHAFNFHRNPAEASARTFGATLLASALVTLAMSGSTQQERDDFVIPPVYENEPTPPHLVRTVTPGEDHYVDASVMRVTEDGPELKLSFPQAFAEDFQATPLDSEQKDKLHSWTHQIEQSLDKPSTTDVEIKVEGLASDESLVDGRHGDTNLGEPSQNNEDLAVQRAKLAAAYLEQELPGKKVDIEVTGGHEVLLSDEQIDAIDTIAELRNMSRDELIQAYNAGELDFEGSDLQDPIYDVLAQPGVLANALDLNRGARLTSTITSQEAPDVGPCDVVVKLVHEPDVVTKDIDPGDNGYGIYLVPFAIPPWPRRRKPQTKEEMKRPVATGPEPRPEPEIESVQRPEEPAEDTQTVEAIKRSKPSVDYIKDLPEVRRPIGNGDDLGVGGRGGSRRWVKPIRRQAGGRRSPAIYRRQMPTWLKRTLAVGVGIALIPFPWVANKPEGDDITTGDECASRTYEEGDHWDIWGNLSSIAVVRALQGRDDWNKQLGPGDIQTTADKVTTTTAPYDRIVVDEQGRIISREHFDGTSETVNAP